MAKFLAPYQRNFNIEPPSLSRYYYYTSVVNAKCQKTFAKLDLQISAELPNPKPLFFAKITFLREHGLAPRQRSCNIDLPGLSRYYYYASTVQTKCQKTFAKLDLQISAELPNPKPLFFAKITFSRKHSLAPRQRSCNIDPPGLSRIMITHQQYKQNVKKHLRNSTSKYQQNCQTQNRCFSQKSRFYVNMVWPLANEVVTSTPRVWVDIMITHQQYKQNVKKHLRNLTSKYQQNCQTQNCCFSQKSRFYVNMVWPLANEVVTSTPRVWVDIMITHQQCKQNVKKHLRNSSFKYQQNCQTQNRCFSQKSRFYVNIVWSLANGVVTSTPRVWVDIMITHQQYKQNVKKHLRNSTSKYQQNCQTQNRCFSQKSRFYVNIVWPLANGVVTSTPRVWVDISLGLDWGLNR